MNPRKNWLMAAVLALFIAAPVTHAQVGKSQGVVDANTAPEADLAKMPHMTPAIAKALVGVRPFKSITDLNTFLIGQGLKQDEAMDFYKKAFIHINLNTATRDEILLVGSRGRSSTRRSGSMSAPTRPRNSRNTASFRST